MFAKYQSPFVALRILENKAKIYIYYLFAINKIGNIKNYLQFSFLICLCFLFATSSSSVIFINRDKYNDC